MHRQSHNLILDLIFKKYHISPDPVLLKGFQTADRLFEIPILGGIKHYLNLNKLFNKHSLYSRILNFYHNENKKLFHIGKILHLIEDLSVPYHLHIFVLKKHLYFEKNLDIYFTNNFFEIKCKYEAEYLKRELNFDKKEDIEDLLLNVVANNLLNKEIDKENIIFNALYGSENFLKLEKII